jgi:hypothetical protein
VPVVRPSPRLGPSWPLKKRSCLISADAGGVGYCTLTVIPALFFTSGLGLGVRLMSVEDASLRSGVGHESDDVRVCPAADHGSILDGDPARRRPASGGVRLQSAAARTAACVVMLLLLLLLLLLLQDIASSSGDGTRRAILEVVSPDVTRLALIREDGRGLGSIDLRC